MSPHRIALCITDLDPGGAERALTDLATRLDRQRFEPAVYCLAHRPAREDRSLAPVLERAGVPVRFLDAARPADFLGVVRRLGRLLASQNPHLLQSFLFHANLAGRFAARRAGVARVVAGIRVAEPRRWQLWADRLTSGRVDRYVCVSRAVARHSADRGGLPAEKLAVIPNGIDVSAYGPAAAAACLPGVPKGRRLVACVGRLDRQKGVDRLLETATDWLARRPECDLILVGDGPDGPRLRRQAETAGLASRVHFLGWRADVPAILAASELLVLPSRWEGMPNVVLQAMASRLPVLAFDVEGVRELLGDAADAQTVPLGNASLWTEKLSRLLSDVPLAQRLGLENRHRAEREFTLDRMTRAYEDLWSRLLDDVPRGGRDVREG